MLASVRGTAAHVGLDGVVVEVGGIGLLVHATPRTLAHLSVGKPAELATTLVVREDSLTLYGFDDAADRDLFETLQTVSGVGPRLALAMLAVLDRDAIAGAVAASDFPVLERVPGIGRKSAQRLVLELAGKLDATARPGVAVSPSRAREQAVEALVNLGWPTRAASDAVSDVEGDDVAIILRTALRRLGGSA